MGTYQSCSPCPVVQGGRDERVVVVVGITHSQTCLVLRNRLRAMREGGFRVVVISSPGVLLDQVAREEAVEQIGIPIKRGIAPFSDLISLIRLCFVLHRLRPEITEFGTPKAGLLGNLAAFICGVRRRVYFLRGLRLETASGMKRRVLQFSEKLAAWCAHVVLCNSESLLEEAKGLGIAGRDKLCVIGDGSSNGVNVERFCPGEDSVRSIYGIPADDPVVGFVGRLTRDKGVLDLIVAFEGLLATVPNAWLLLVGWFDESEDALSVVEREWINSHPRVVRTGFVDDAALYYRAMDVMVLPTWREGFPNVVLEAGASGIPVISTLSTGSRDAVLPEVTGLLIPPGYPEAILEAMLDLLGNRERRLKMGKAAHAWVLERFANQRVLGLTVAFYQEMARDATAERIGETITVAAATAD